MRFFFCSLNKMLAHQSRSLSAGFRIWRAEPGVSATHGPAGPLLPGHWLQVQCLPPGVYLGIQGCSAEPHHLFFLRIHTTHAPPPQPQSHKGWLRHLLGGLVRTLEMLISRDSLHSAVLPCLSSHGCLYPWRLKLVLRSIPNKGMGIVTILFITFFLLLYQKSLYRA